MIYQYKLTLKPNGIKEIPQTWSYRLYAWMLSKIPEKEAEAIHDTESKLVSQYIYENVWTVNLLSDIAYENFHKVLTTAKKIYLKSDLLLVESCEMKSIEAPQQIINKASKRSLKRVQIDFLTPTAFKQNGRYTILPKEELIIQSLITSWNDIFPDYYFSDADALEMVKNGVRITDYDLVPNKFLLKGYPVPSFTGSVVIETKLPIVLLEIWSSLIYLSQYTGIGMKGTLGMGGVRIKSVK